MLSFPMEGYTLALDFPASGRAFDLLEELDDLVLRHGGRLYLTKDARMSRAMLDEGYPDAEAFRALRREVDPRGVLSSLQAQRLGL
jgi:FAD/FMN-containing dehydrogenase